MTTKDAVMDALGKIIDPCSATTGSNLDIVEMGLVKSVSLDGSNVVIDMRVTSPVCMMVGYFRKEAEKKVGVLSGVDSVTVETDAGLEWDPDMMTEEAKAKRQRVLNEYQEATDMKTAQE